MKFRKKPVVIEAHQWFKNGDHPDDYRDARPGMARHDDGDRLGHYVEIPGEVARKNGWEGAVVRYFRRPDVPGDAPCSECNLAFHDHGWIDTKEDGHRVCPGDWIITGIQGERYPCKPGIFAATYEPADTPPSYVQGDERDRHVAALELIWNLRLREKVHLGLERASGLENGCIACVCALALGRSLDGAASAEEFRNKLQSISGSR